VIKHAEAMDFAAFHAAYETIVEKARTNRLLPDDFAGGTLQLTNPGTLGTVASVPRLMKGQGAIIATGPNRDGAGAQIITITSTYDHRISGRRVRNVSQAARRALAGRGTVLRTDNGEPGGWASGLGARG
jgi:pyruvate/2-oxoglutarate dehydrogenase complex dihydrolipoamide acyltransferase (E2) component